MSTRPCPVPAAFPQPAEWGLTKREYVAASILATLADLATPTNRDDIVSLSIDLADRLLVRLGRDTYDGPPWENSGVAVGGDADEDGSVTLGEEIALPPEPDRNGQPGPDGKVGG